MNTQEFGQAPDGSTVRRAIVSGGGLTLNLLSFGAIVQDLRLAGHESPLVLGFDNLDSYLKHSPYFGATAGRYANRIRDGRFDIDGVSHQCDRNFLGKHLLHGGAGGIGKRNWKFVSVTNNAAILELDDADGAMGFPGNCLIRASFTLPGDGRLSIRYEAQTDQATLVNLAHHSYFCLDDTGGILDHEVQISADAYLPVDEEMIPTGEVRAVDGTAFDFRKLRPVRHDAGDGQVVYDHNFCLSQGRGQLLQVAEARSRISGVRMQVMTTEPGLQFYAGHKVNPPVAGLTGRMYGAYSGFCFEPQVWPDSPNHRHFPQALLRPGERYDQESEFRFSKG